METNEQESLEARYQELESKSGQELLAVSRISAALSDLRDLDAILRVALNNVLRIMNGDMGGILLVDEHTQTLSYHIHQGLSDKYVGEMTMKPGEGIAGRVALNGKAIFLEDISADPRIAHPDLVNAEGLKAFISIPLRAKDKVLGVINVASRNPRSFTRSDIHLLYSIGDQLGVAIEQARLYERLRRTRERYRQLARQTLLVQEEERRRLARELHDETSQALSGLALQLQAIVDRAEMSGNRDTEMITGLKKVQSLTVQVHNEINRLIADLRPSLLDTIGLIPAIRQYAESNLHHAGIDVTFESKGNVNRLPPEVEVGVFRWAQGAIGNIAQHSKAKNASILIEFRGDELYLRIIDDGQGFNVAEITSIEESGRGRGVFSMKERVSLLGGICAIESQPGHGTTVWSRIPLGDKDEDAQDKGAGRR